MLKQADSWPAGYQIPGGNTCRNGRKRKNGEPAVKWIALCQESLNHPSQVVERHRPRLSWRCCNDGGLPSWNVRSEGGHGLSRINRVISLEHQNMPAGCA